MKQTGAIARKHPPFLFGAILYFAGSVIKAGS